MNRHEINATNCRFSNSLWTNPRNGETRLYINGVHSGSKVWVTENSEGRPELHWRKGYGAFYMEDAYAAFDAALEALNILGNVTFNAIITASLNPTPVHVERLASRAMKAAHRIRRAAAARFDCKASEIIFGECLRQAWAEIKAEAGKPQIITNEKGFVVFQNRNWSFSGDKNTWARVDADKLIVNIGKGIISSGYMEELETFLAPYNLKITTGRVTVAL